MALFDPFKHPDTPARQPSRPRLHLPTLTGLIPYEAELALRTLVDHANSLDATITAMASPGSPPASPLDATLLDQIRNALSTGGSHPLSVFNLLGSSQMQIRALTHEQRLALNPASQRDGALFWETDRTALLIVANAQWAFVGNLPFACNLFPSTRPADLTLSDAGFQIHATDFDRLYRWTGAVWHDAAGQPKREIVWIPTSIHALFEPTTGYQLCDGTANVRASLPDASTVLITVPDMTTLNRFLRAVAGATGGVGGNATAHLHGINPPPTTSTNNSASQSVASGSGVDVAANPHTHSTDITPFNSGIPSGTGGDDALPPYYNARPYLRL